MSRPGTLCGSASAALPLPEMQLLPHHATPWSRGPPAARTFARHASSSRAASLRRDARALGRLASSPFVSRHSSREDPSAASAQDGQTALHHAAAGGHESAVSVLLDNHADLEAGSNVSGLGAGFASAPRASMGRCRDGVPALAGLPVHHLAFARTLTSPER